MCECKRNSRKGMSASIWLLLCLPSESAVYTAVYAAVYISGPLPTMCAIIQQSNR